MQAGNTALIRAVLNGHVEVVILLLSRGVDKEYHNTVK
jgi:ankyrin repeat protein